MGGTYLGGSTVIRIGPDGTRWGSEDSRDGVVLKKARKRLNEKPVAAAAPKQDNQKEKVERSYIQRVCHAEVANEKMPKPPKSLRTAVTAAGGFIEWCRLESRRDAWRNQGMQRAIKKAQKRARRGI